METGTTLKLIKIYERVPYKVAETNHCLLPSVLGFLLFDIIHGCKNLSHVKLQLFFSKNSLVLR